jgi:hypothetical protein
MPGMTIPSYDVGDKRDLLKCPNVGCDLRWTCDRNAVLHCPPQCRLQHARSIKFTRRELEKADRVQEDRVPGPKAETESALLGEVS